MSNRENPSNADYGSGHYKICVKGHIDKELMQVFDGMNFEHTQEPSTVFHIFVVDQAALYSVLRKVRDLGMILISINSSKKQEKKV